MALGALAVALPSASERVQHAIDYAGAVLLAVGLSAIVLLTTLGGTSYDWASVQIVGLGVIGVAGILAFLRAESRAAEPILPLRLFRNRVFAITSAIGFVIGFALFGALTYLPLFQQVVRGYSPDRVGPAADPGDGRRADRLDRLGPGDHGHRPLQAVPDRRHGDRRARHAPALAPGRADLDALRLRRDVRDGLRARAGHAGARARRAERRRVLRARRRHVRRDAVPLDGRLARHGRARRDLHRPADRGAVGHARRRRRRRRDRPERRPAAPRTDPRPSYTGAFTDALVDRVPGRRGGRRRRLPAVVADRGAPAAPDRRHRGRRRGVRLPEQRRLAARADARAVAARRPRAARARSSSAPSRPRASICRPGAAWLLVQGEEGVPISTIPRRSPPTARSTPHGCTSSSTISTRRGLVASDAADRRRARDRRAADRARATSPWPRWSPTGSHDDDPRVNDAIGRLAQELAREEPVAA